MLCNILKKNCFHDGSAWLVRNRVTFSSLTEFECEKYDAPTYSIKYVLSGTEHYVLGNRNFAVNAGQFLLVNKNHALDAVIRSKKPVEGFCIHLEPAMLNDIYTQLRRCEDSLLDDPFEHLTIPDFQEQLYSHQKSCLGVYLSDITRQFDRETIAIDINEQELYYRLAWHLVSLNNNTTGQKMEQRLTAIRTSTKKELLRRLEIARAAIEADNYEWLDINSIAREGMLSPAHFLRCFKKVYRITPYQYQLKQKMDHAAYLLVKKNMRPSEVAYLSGYTDIASFSKAFKKNFQQAPTHYIPKIN